MNTQANDMREIREELETLRQDFSTLLIATVSADRVPDASYAAYVERDGDYYVYVSELATHTRNLQDTGRASVLFIEDESLAGHLFARRRLTYQCDAVAVARDSEEFFDVMSDFAGRFGKLIDTIRALDDFHLFRLRPGQGLYVAGFARAYAMDGADLGGVRHIRDRGHRRSPGMPAGHGAEAFE
jgi:heme iron utilization protein